MTQIGNGNSRHEVTLPDGTEVELAWSAATDTGLRRSVNEDSYVAQAPVFAVADGMGGHAAGDFASAAVVTRLAEHGGRAAVGTAEIDAALKSAVQDMGRGTGVTDEGSGTTVTGVGLGLVGDEPAWIVFNIGDSRVYRLVGGVLEQLTVDHSIVQELVDAGQITREEADTHPHSNVITRAVGFHEAPIPDYRAIPLEEGMRLLLCSDGLTKELTSYGIRHFLTSGRSPDQAVRQLVEAAVGNGGRDNVTVIVLDVLRVVRPSTGDDAG
ncbi:PP2C family protein-serine/threonine phosphatase [Agromyces marinus]|uniref:Serine/threonine protein phosphatase n=1 Tax=Agromyces marinus TaxID=1389020 RepID=A0ABM8GYQ0_9MICO|nr:protein phosphatase 2C domain-containing protein [Agromyces marinus]UIP58165.1 Protein phosphatase PrpC [Agromyces marinus]BDZ53605.1 serine/threonine protein phosphatase [Agromyces marinus]